MHTHGFQMNRADSERMAGHLEHLTYISIDVPFRALLLTLNTCTILDHVESRVYSYLRRHVFRKREYRRELMLVVADCLDQQDGERML